MSETLEALVEGRRMGRLIYHEKKDLISFQYDENWAGSPDAFPLSLSIPLVRPDHPDAIVRAFISNLLPDNYDILERWGKRFHVSPRNPFRLLRHVGEECAGAVQFVLPERAPDWLAGNSPEGVDWLDETDLAQRIRELVANHAAARRATDRGQFSLAGAQPKMGLFRDPESGSWGVPMGATPTTHILKPNVAIFRDYDQNEHFCLRLAARLGLPAARSWIERIGEIPVIVIERYDRVHIEGRFRRVHQEDSCQAMGIMPGSKYERDGGPPAKTIFDLIRTHSSKPEDDELRFLDALIFNWLIKGTDAHSKNYSFLLAAGPQVRLARLYDLSSWFPYELSGEARKTKLAMKIGGKYKLSEIGPGAWEKAAAEWKLSYDEVAGRIVQLAGKLPGATSGVTDEMAATIPPESDLVTRLANHISDRAERYRKAFAG